MAYEVLIPGTAVAENHTIDPTVADPFAKDQAMAEVAVSSSRGDSQGQVPLSLPEDHLIEIELENGLILYRRLDTLENGPLSRGAGPADVLALPRSLDVGGASRGAAQLAVRVYRFFSGEGLAKDAALQAAHRLESVLIDPQDDVLRRWNGAGDHAEPGPLKPGTKMLVMIHGTFSTTEGTFGGLIPADGVNGASQLYWDALQAAFDDGRHIYGFEHRTVTQSPVQNAIRLLEQLPVRAEVHFLTHSRGGLIAELIARTARVHADAAMGEAFDADDLTLLESARKKAGQKKANTDAEIAALKRLRELIAEKQPVIKNFVRVACPARGTVLASDRLDKALSLLLGLMRMVPGPQQAMVGLLAPFVKTMIATRTDADVMPGLEAMMPKSPLIALMNRADIEVDAQLNIIAGDIEPRGVLRALAVFATDLFFRDDHDVVVNTQAMEGGARRKTPAKVFVDQGDEVNHFSYFQNRRTAQQVVDLLSGRPGTMVPQSIAQTVAASGSRGRPVIQGKRPVAIMLPGIQGSQLTVDDQKYWVSPLRLAFGGIGKIGAKGGRMSENVSSSGSIPKYYGALLDKLSESHDTVDFHYDWRKSIADAADLLNDRVNEILAATEDEKQPIRFVAHSMGGLVVRAMIARHRDTWDRVVKGREGSRFVMLGTPNGGSMSIVWALMGQDKMMRMLETLDVTNGMADMLAEIMPMPGVLELLPADFRHQYFDPKVWRDLRPVSPTGWRPPEKEWLLAAKRVQKALKLRPRDAQYMSYIAGKADITPVSIDIQPPAREGDKPRARLLATRDGDGRVTWRTGRLDGVPTWYAPTTVHGDLARDARLFPAILDLVQRGQTSALSQDPPASRGGERFFEVQPEDVLFPSEADLEAAAMGGNVATVTTPDKTEERCRVSIGHGDLRMHPGAIMVGHYQNAPLMNAEQALDDRIGGQMSVQRNFGLYPGALKTAEVFFCKPSGFGPDSAVVAGLGAFGELSRAHLTATLAQAVLLYALRSQQANRKGARSLATLLIGHRDSMLTVRDSLQATLEAVRHANRRLPDEHRIQNLTVLELFEDTAIEAAQHLQEFAKDTQWTESFAIDGALKTAFAGRQRYATSGEISWEQKIRITVDKDNPSQLMFEGLNRSALIARNEISVDRSRLQRYIQSATESTSDHENTGKLLFEWLVPPQMKSVASDGRNLTLLVDTEAASFPWELMEDNWSGSEKPVAVNANLIRQLMQEPRNDQTVVAATDRVLIVGDPKSFFRPLPAAKAEAKHVADLFRKTGWSKHDVIEKIDEITDVESEFTLHENRILHFAGHGVHNWGDAGKTGLIIGKNNVLEPGFVRSLRYTPEFVFLNCCHVGKIDGSFEPDELTEVSAGRTPKEAATGRAEFAANIAVEFMQAGSHAVIAAGWEVDDDAAAAFADAFYRAFLGGDTFADAVRKGRSAAYDRNASVNTWGAYQCYGDPQYRLRRNTLPVKQRQWTETFSAPAQVSMALKSLRIETRFAQSALDLQDLKTRFGEISEQCAQRSDWQNDPLLYETLGAAASELGETTRAIGYFEKMLQGSRRSYSLEMLDKLMELRLRQATVAREDAEQSEQPDAIEAALVHERSQAEALLSHLEHHRTVSGRFSSAKRDIRIGDTWLRLGAIARSKAQAREYTENAVKSFGQATGPGRAPTAITAMHARIRGAFADYLIALSDGKGLDAAIIAEINAVMTDLADNETALPSFERSRLWAEARLFSLLADHAHTTSFRDALIDEYSRIFLQGASPGKRLETIADLKTVARLLQRGNPLVGQRVSEIADELSQSAT